MLPRIVARLVRDGVITAHVGNACLEASHRTPITAGHSLLKAWLEAESADRRVQSPWRVLQPPYAGLKPTTFRPDNLEVLLAGEQPEVARFLLEGFRDGFPLHRLGEWEAVHYDNGPFTDPQAAAAYDALNEAEGPSGHGYTCPCPPEITKLQCDPSFMVKKMASGQHKGGFRRVNHKSKFSDGHPSVNEGIPDHLGEIEYPDVSDMTTEIRRFQRRGATAPEVGKADCARAFRLYPMAPADYGSLGFTDRQGVRHIDSRLSMGLKQGSRLFSSLSMTVGWLLRHVFGIVCVVYIDDFGFVSFDHEESRVAVSAALLLFRLLGIPIADKTEWGQSAMVFLGKLIDIPAGTIGFHATKERRILDLIAAWEDPARVTCTISELETLSGVLCDAVAVVPQGRLFLRRIFALLGYARSRERDLPAARSRFLRIPVSGGLRADLHWWATFLPLLNGKRPFIDKDAPLRVRVPSDHLESSDASDLAVAGVEHTLGEFYRLDFLGVLEAYDKVKASIALREMLAICISAGLWGPCWANRHVILLCDNKSDVDSVRRMGNANSHVEHLLRVFACLALIHNFSFEIEWLPSAANVEADAATRVPLSVFMQQCSHLRPREVSWLPPLPTDKWEQPMVERARESFLQRSLQ